MPFAPTHHPWLKKGKARKCPKPTRDEVIKSSAVVTFIQHSSP